MESGRERKKRKYPKGLNGILAIIGTFLPCLKAFGKIKSAQESGLSDKGLSTTCAPTMHISVLNGP